MPTQKGMHTLFIPQEMRSPELGLANTGCLGPHGRWPIFVLWEASFLWNPMSPPAPIPVMRYLIRSSYFSPFSSIDKHLNEQEFVFLGFTWDSVPFSLFSRGIKRDKEKAFLDWQSCTALAQGEVPETSFLGVRVPGPTLTVSWPPLTEQYLNQDSDRDSCLWTRWTINIFPAEY